MFALLIKLEKFTMITGNVTVETKLLLYLEKLCLGGKNLARATCLEKKKIMLVGQAVEN